VEVGQAQDEDALTGVTVVLCRKGATGGVDVRGSAPGTRETDLLNPINLVDKVHAITLAGGSAFGLDAATGVVRWLEEQGIGFNTGCDAAVPSCQQQSCLTWVWEVKKFAQMQTWVMRRRQQPGQVRFAEGNVGAGTGASIGRSWARWEQ